MRHAPNGAATRGDGIGPTVTPMDRLGRVLGRTRFVVLLGVFAVLLLSITLFIVGAVQAASSIWHAISAALGGKLPAAEFTVELLEVVATMLKAVVFYLVGVGLYSLFISPLNLPEALGIATLNDLETKIVSVVIVILAITFLEHFILWQEPVTTMQLGLTMAVVVAALVLFQMYLHRAKEDQMAESTTQDRAQERLFVEDKEMGEVARQGDGA